VKGMPYTGCTIEETLQEVLKYAVKFYSKDPVSGEIKALPASVMPILAKTLEKTRRVRAYGVFFNIPEPDRAAHSCQACGARMVCIPVDYFVTFCNTGFLPLEWKAAGEEAGLHLKLADNSHLLTSGIPPPNNQTQALRQVQMDWATKVRQKDDWSKKK